jgi:hypothetical protein
MYIKFENHEFDSASKFFRWSLRALLVNEESPLVTILIVYAILCGWRVALGYAVVNGPR